MRLPPLPPLLLLLGAVRAGAEAAGDLRLVGGGSAREGRLEIFAADGATWQRVCDDGWDDADAQVACRQLGMGGGKAYKGPGSAEAVVVHAFDGAPAAAAWPRAAECGGDEETLASCVNASAAAVTCSNSEHAGLACSSGIVLLIIIATSGAAVVAALLLTCRLAIRHARESAGLDAIKCSDVCHAWCAVVGHLPRACISLCCGSKSGGSSGSYGRSRRSKASAVSVQQTSPEPAPEPGPAPAAAAGGREAGPGRGSGAQQPEPAPSGAEHRAAVAQRWMAEAGGAAGVAALQASTAAPVRRPSEVIAEARGEAPGERKRRKSQVTQEWLEQSQSAVSPGAITHSALSPRRSPEAAAESAAAAAQPAQDVEAAQEQVRDAALP